MASHFFETHIRPAIIQRRHRHIVEIGVGAGANTGNLLGLAEEIGGFLHCIDPSPQFEPSAECHCVALLKKPSLQALGKLKQVDCAIIDGDHNWYTVYNELQMTDKVLVPGGTVFLHDVLWPYGRRDMYHEPGRIPRKYRHPNQKMGIVQGEMWLSPEGMNGDYYNALYEGGSRNGVLTAVEDFLRTRRNYRLSLVQDEHGLAELRKLA